MEFFDTSKFLDAISEMDIHRTAAVTLSKDLSSLAKTADRCKICRYILSNAHEFEDESPTVKMEYSFGPEAQDIKRMSLTYQGPVSEDGGFGTSYSIVLCRFVVLALPGNSGHTTQDFQLKREM